MGFIFGINDFVFPPEQAFRFGSLDFNTKDFGKISLLDSDSNQSGRDQISVLFGIPNSAEVYPRSYPPSWLQTTRTRFNLLRHDPIKMMGPIRQS
jgi:hypothetical protein